MFNKIHSISLTIICLFIILSCQKTELLDEVVFDNSLLNKISLNVAEKKIIISYETTLNEPFIEHVMQTSPSARVLTWLDKNIINFGTVNKIIIDIKKASIIRKEIEGKVEVALAGVTKKQNQYLYELNFEVLFILYNDTDHVLATTKAEVFRTTTSSKLISLNERDRILDNITLNSLIDLSDKSFELLKIHMSEYML